MNRRNHKDRKSDKIKKSSKGNTIKRWNKKYVIISSAAVCVIAVVVIAAIVFGTRDGGFPVTADDITASGENGSSGMDGNDKSTEDSAGNDSAESSGEDGDGQGDNAGGNNSGNERDSSGSTQGTGNQNGSTQPGEELSFPFNISGTTLTVRNISSYDGIYLEDGSDEEVSGIAAMVVENTGDVNVEYAMITVKCNGETLQFDVSDIPAGDTVVVQEKNRAGYQNSIYTDCSAVVAETDEFEMSEDKVRVEETGEGSLRITNLTDEEIPCVRIFYKFYMEEEQTYVGGITYTAKVTGLSAGGSQTVTPSHYSSGNSLVMMVRTYDTAQ